MKHYVIRVTGKVQGVFFRDTARQIATGLGLTGLARNEPDGSVYIEVEGDEAALQGFLAWCQQGSDLAQVERVEHAEHEPAGHKGFTVS